MKRKDCRRLLSPILFSVFISIISLALATPAYATPESKSSNDAVATFNLNNPSKQEETVTLPDGTKGTLGIEPVVSMRTRASYDLGSGTGNWHVYYYTGVLNTGYYVRISNYRITSAYDNHYSGAGCVIDSCTLAYGSTWSTQTTHAHEIVSGLKVSETRLLKGNISGHNLVTSVRAY